MTDAELIARVLADDDRVAFGTLVRRHQSSVRNFLRHLATGDAALADDLAQQTFIHAYRRLSQFRGQSAFSSWLLGIAYNHFRNARREKRETRLVEHEEIAEPTPAPPTRAADLRADLADALNQLSPEQQTALYLCYQQGFSHHEAAGAMGCPIGTVKTHIARGKDRLRQLLASWNPQT